MKYLIILLGALLCSCAGNNYSFKKGDIVYVKSLGGKTRFEIIQPLPGGFYQAWDLSTGSHIEHLAGRNLKPVKIIKQPKTQQNGR